MKTLNRSVDQIAQDLNIPSHELVNRGLLAYLEREIRLAEEEIADIRDKYLVTSRIDLERKIQKKAIASHPAWEDLITWENVEAYIKKLKQTIKRIR